MRSETLDAAPGTSDTVAGSLGRGCFGRTVDVDFGLTAILRYTKPSNSLLSGKTMVFTDAQKAKALEMARSLADTFDPKEALEFAKKHIDLSWYGDFKLLLGMLIDKEFTMDKSTWLLIAGAVAYAVMPMDVIPDFIPGMGFVDDAFVISSVMKKIADEVERYREKVR